MIRDCELFLPEIAGEFGQTTHPGLSEKPLAQANDFDNMLSKYIDIIKKGETSSCKKSSRLRGYLDDFSVVSTHRFVPV